jgi:hypothetical protein
MFRFRRAVVLSSLFCTPLFIASVPSAAEAAEATGENLIQIGDRSTPSFYGSGIAWETIVEQWEGDQKKASQRIKLQTKGDNTLAEFTAPAKVSGRKLLMKDRNMWFLKPGLLKPVPISPRQRLLGAAAFGDLISVSYATDYDIVSSSDVDLEGEACVLFELAAKTKEAMYPKLKYWASKSRKVGIRTEYFTESGSLLKWASFDFKNTLDVGDPRPRVFLSRIVIHDPNSTDSVAVISIGHVQLTTVPDATFDLNLLTQ